MQEKEQDEKAAHCQQRALGVSHRHQRQAGSSTLGGLTSRVTMLRLGESVIAPALVPLPTPPTPNLPHAATPPPVPSPIHLSTFSPLVDPSSNLPDCWSPVPCCLWSPPRILERPRLDGAAYHRAHVDIASSCDPAIANLWDAYGDSHWLELSHPIYWEPLPPMLFFADMPIFWLRLELHNPRFCL
ncbi:hypothetical protein BT96DRAFT_1003764 [Gymnopus androsaceus JB14]|uniref:Uncharacterized protein n=1 Tax=Gymnopus androsaceus JB14 TaxID=1447944 RepID=A0A6A4GT75_9AGAR|nr:hypothetical protein BT96DRAFT_1003764 [Gymnopus androsaceus JB14]